jgi:hypothetical protein
MEPEKASAITITHDSSEGGRKMRGGEERAPTKEIRVLRRALLRTAGERSASRGFAPGHVDIAKGKPERCAYLWLKGNR